MTRKRAVFFCILLAAINTFILYQNYGTGDQKSELPLLNRAMDPGYLPNDFYVNSASEYGPRFIYSKIIAAVATEDTLPWIVFLLTLFVNIIVSLVSYSIALEIFGHYQSRETGILAAGLVMSVHLFSLGYHKQIIACQLLSSTLAFAFIALSFWMAFRLRPYLCAVFGGLAAWIHPTFGAESGALAVFVAACGFYFRHENQRKKKAGVYAKGYGWHLMGALGIFFLMTAIPLVPYFNMPHISAEQFMDIETRFRHPHHSLAGYMSEWELAAACLISFSLVWLLCRKQPRSSQPHLQTILLLTILVLILCTAGLFFVEVIPMKIWAIARPFRLIFLLKWLGLILMAGFISGMFTGKAASLTKSDLLYVLPSLLFPLAMVFSVSAASFRSHIHKKTHGETSRLFSVVPLVFAVLVGIYIGYLCFSGNLPWPVVLAFSTSMGIWFLALTHPSKRFLFSLTALILLILLAPFLRFFSAGIIPDQLLAPLDLISPGITYGDTTGYLPQTASFARENTGVDAMFLTPPDFGLFRLMAGRAIVVDWKSFPFQEEAMVRWKKRLDDCYGRSKKRGHMARDELADLYRGITDEKILSLRIEYGFSYCILYAGTATRFPVVYENRRYKIISLINEEPPLTFEEMRFSGYSRGFSVSPLLHH